MANMVQVVHCVTLLITFAIRTVDSAFECYSNRLNANLTNFRYADLNLYTYDTCAQCYSFILGRELLIPRVVNKSGKRIWFRPFEYCPDTRTARLCKNNGTWIDYSSCIYPDPATFNKNDPSNDTLLSTFSSNFSMVSWLSLRCHLNVWRRDSVIYVDITLRETHSDTFTAATSDYVIRDMS